MITAWLIVALLFPGPQGTTGLLTTNAAGGGGGCNEFTETTWDNLTGWTQDSGGNFSANATNDELDMGGVTLGDVAWISNDTDTTDSDQCAMWEYADIDTDMTAVHLALRFPTGNTEFYTVGYDWGDSLWAWATYARAAGGGSWQSTTQTSGAAAPVDGDYVSACVEGSGSGTTVTIWNHGASNPGDCRTDWGAADITFTDNPAGGDVVDGNTLVGLIIDHWSGGADSSGGIFDEFAGSDY